MSPIACRPFSRPVRALVLSLATAVVALPVLFGVLRGTAGDAQTLEKRKGIEFVSVNILRADGSTVDHSRALEAFRELVSPYQVSGRPDAGPYGRWLKEVDLIIQPMEREALLRLSSDPEREHFVEQFWARRDPTPETAENEFKAEHYRRIAYAKQRFGFDVEGAQTDRGRVYVVLGPPDEIESHPVEGFEEWMYHKFDGSTDRLLVRFATRAAQDAPLSSPR